MKIALASDHAGFHYKEAVKIQLQAAGHETVDFGAPDDRASDYPTYIVPAAEAVARGDVERGIVFGGSGNGEAIAANKVRGIRCGLCWTEESARLNRLHNDGNMLSLGQRLVPLEDALRIVDVWLSTGFEGGRHEGRIRMLDDLGSPPRAAGGVL